MKKLVMLSLLSSATFLLSACDSGSDSSQPTAAQLQACAQAVNCNPALAAKRAGINPGILTNAIAPAATGNIQVASGGQTDLTNTNASTGGIVVLGANENQFNAAKITDAKSGVNMENFSDTLNKAIATGNKSPTAFVNSYEQSNEGAAGAK